MNMKSVKKEYKKYLSSEQGARSYNNFKSIFYGEEDTLVSELNRLISINSNKKVLNVLDIGGGDGKRIRKILKFLNSKTGVDFNLDFVDQSSSFIKEFQRTKNDIEQFTRINILHSDFEDTKLKKEYDIILVIHSIFAFDNINSIQKIFNKVKRDGKIYIVSNDSNSFLSFLKEKVDELFPDTRFEINLIKNYFSSINLTYKKYVFYTKWRAKYSQIKTQLEEVLNWISLGDYLKMNNSTKSYLHQFVMEFDSTTSQEFLINEKEICLIIDGSDVKDIIKEKSFKTAIL